MRLAPLLALVLLSACASDGLMADEMPMRGPSETVGLGQPAYVRNFMVVPVRLIEDSRCPASVQCVQAGTVRIAAEIRYAESLPEPVELKLGEPVAHDRWSVVLRDVQPVPQAPGAIPPAAYRFTIDTPPR